MLTVVTWKWETPGYRSTFTSDTVNVLARMVGRHYKQPHRVVCVTDQPEGLDSAIEPVPAWNDFANVPSPHGKRNPSCYRRLRLFHPEAEQFFGPRFVSIDLDAVIVNDMAPLWDRSEDVVLWGDSTNPQPGSIYNGSMQLLRACARPGVWNDFDPRTSPDLAMRAGAWGSDQGWLSYKLGRHEAKWTKADGVYSYRNHIKPTRDKALPADARVVFFHGADDPWTTGQSLQWVRQHWC